MNSSWVSSVKRSGQLTVFKGTSVRGHWSQAVDRAMDYLNGRNLGLQWSPSTAAWNANGTSGADVRIEVGDSFEVTIMGQSGRVTVPTASGTHGRTRLAREEARDGSLAIGKAFILLPTTPAVQGRATGVAVMTVIAAHELVHACGMEDHSPFSDSDLMNSTFSTVYGGRAHPEQDQLQTQNQRLMPPIFISDNTAAVIAGLW